jgi:hypothetical protein
MMVYNGWFILDAKIGDAPIAGWFMMENPEEKVDDLGGTPMTGTPCMASNGKPLASSEHRWLQNLPT